MNLPPYPMPHQRSAYYIWLNKNATGRFKLICGKKTFNIQVNETYCNSYFEIVFISKNSTVSRVIQKLKLRFDLINREIFYNEVDKGYKQ